MKLSKIDKLKIALGLMKEHSHEQENARRRRQIERGILRPTATEMVMEEAHASE